MSLTGQKNQMILTMHYASKGSQTMPILIEDIPVENRKSEFVEALHALKPGQSFRCERSSASASTGIRQAKIASKVPLAGEFAVTKEGNGCRVGRIS